MASVTWRRPAAASPAKNAAAPPHHRDLDTGAESPGRGRPMAGRRVVERALGDRGPQDDLVRPPGVRAGERAGDGEPRIGAAGVVAERVEPAERGLDLADPGEHGCVPGHQRGRQRPVVARQRVPDGRDRLVVVGQPARGPRVQPRRESGFGVREVVAQHRGEQVVEAEPVAAVVERDDEQLLALGPAEQLGGVGPAGDGGGQVGAELVEDRRAAQDEAQVVGQRREDLVPQVVDEVAAALEVGSDRAGRRGGPGRGVAPAGQHAEVHPDHPALGAFVQAGGVVRGPDGAGHGRLRLEQVCVLRGGQAQVVGVPARRRGPARAAGRAAVPARSGSPARGAAWPVGG